MKDQIEIKKSSLYLVGIVILIVLGIYFISNTGGNSITGNAVANNVNGDAQNIVIGMKNFNYYPNTIKVKANQPVSISLDKSVYGCLRDFTIREFGVRKYLRTPEDTIVFTPTKKGTFGFACSMGMGTGTLIVE
ncbi:cupredoxin domain-containing protein [Candidatus Woesearchaeota archaeon]|nr:cupredoxin domain-containing protein [Candidatus Woesearchaeota archaeon]